MFKQFKIGSYRMSLSLNKVCNVDGVCSNLADGNHILMWDFDNAQFQDVCLTLVTIQYKYRLPTIYVLESSPDNYIAYCFTSLPFPKAVSIVADTRYADWTFVKLAILRGYFTLRISKKSGHEPKLVTTIRSEYPELANVDSLRKFVRYETVVKDTV